MISGQGSAKNRNRRSRTSGDRERVGEALRGRRHGGPGVRDLTEDDFSAARR